MKKLLFVLPFLILLSCSVQKRKYQKGFYVSNSKHKKHVQGPDSKVQKTHTEEIVILTQRSLPLKTASDNNEQLFVSAAKKPLKTLTPHFKKKIISPDSLCDRLVLKDGNESSVKILEITPIEIKYKKCDMPDGPLYIVKKNDVFMIAYANGTKEVFRSETPAVTNNTNTPASTYKGPKKLHPMALLSFIFGIVGIWPLTGLASIFAIIFGNIALKKIKQNPDKYKGETLAQAGRIMGIVILSVIAAVVIIALLIVLLTI